MSIWTGLLKAATYIDALRIRSFTIPANLVGVVSEQTTQGTILQR